MKNILFICGRTESAVGRIACNLAHEIQKKHNVYFVGLKTSNKDNIIIKNDYTFYSHVYYYDFLKDKSKNMKGISSKFFYELSKRYERIYEHNFFGIKPQMNRYINICNKLIKKKQIDCIVTFYMPFEILDIGYILRSKFPNVEWIPYLFDNFDYASQNDILAKYFIWD